MVIQYMQVGQGSYRNATTLLQPWTGPAGRPSVTLTYTARREISRWDLCNGLCRRELQRGGSTSSLGTL